MTTVDERIRSHLNNGWPFSTRASAIQAVLDLHQTDDTGTLCGHCLCPDPCETKLVIARGLGVLAPVAVAVVLPPAVAARVIHITPPVSAF